MHIASATSTDRSIVLPTVLHSLPHKSIFPPKTVDCYMCSESVDIRHFNFLTLTHFRSLGKEILSSSYQSTSQNNIFFFLVMPRSSLDGFFCIYNNSHSTFSELFGDESNYLQSRSFVHKSYRAIDHTNQKYSPSSHHPTRSPPTSTHDYHVLHLSCWLGSNLSVQTFCENQCQSWNIQNFHARRGIVHYP